MCDLGLKVKVIGKKAGICDDVPSTAALVVLCFGSHDQNRHHALIWKKKHLKHFFLWNKIYNDNEPSGYGLYHLHSNDDSKILY